MSKKFNSDIERLTLQLFYFGELKGLQEEWFGNWRRELTKNSNKIKIKIIRLINQNKT